jgi:hypothetical protein
LRHPAGGAHDARGASERSRPTRTPGEDAGTPRRTKFVAFRTHGKEARHDGLPNLPKDAAGLAHRPGGRRTPALLSTGGRRTPAPLDRSQRPHAEKVARNRPAEARDACTIAGVTYDWTPGSICELQFTYTGLTRTAAGGPDTNDVLKCQLKPLNGAEYNVSFTETQWARLQQAFPQGVCDYAKPGVAQQPSAAPWLSFSGGPGGVPLGDPPVSD